MLDTFLGCISFLLMNLSLLYISHLIVRRFVPSAPTAARLVSTGTLYYAFIIVIFQALSPFHAITKTGVSISCLALALCAQLLWGRYRDFQADLQPLRVWVKEGLSSRWAALIVICGFVVFLSLSRALLMPPLAWDSLTYHLTSAALWVQKGTLVLFKAPDQMQCTYLPMNGEIFASWLLLPFHNDLLANVMNFPITLLGGISCYAIARELGLNRKESSWAPALICFAPMIYSEITTQYVDNAVFAFCCAAFLFTLRYLQKENFYDVCLAFIAAGILLGIKYNAIPAVGLIGLVITIKTIRLSTYPGIMKKLSIILFGLIIICILGGRQYINNSIEARNPFYPFPLKLFQHEVFKGWAHIAEQEKSISDYEKATGRDTYGFWQREYGKFLYREMTAGPKFFLFLMLALLSILIRPQNVSIKSWYFLSIMWIVPLSIHYADTSAQAARSGAGMQGSTRYITSYIALFTIQALIFTRQFRNYFKTLKFIFVIFIVWDILHINITHIYSIGLLYPFVGLGITAIVFLFMFFIKSSTITISPNQYFSDLHGPCSQRIAVSHAISVKRILAYIISFVILVGMLYFLQLYRNNTRYVYYREHTDLHSMPREFVDAWEFLDKPEQKKIIALAKGWHPLFHAWFFYPLLGRLLQNDIVYISAKYKHETPAWLDQGDLRGNDFSIWLDNLKTKKVDYLLIQTPWPIELKWVQQNPDKFQLLLSQKEFNIFKYIK